MRMRRVLTKFVPCVLTIDQQKYSLSVVSNPLQEAEMDQNFTEDISTGEETLVDGCDPETKHYFLQWKCPESPTPTKEYQLRSSQRPADPFDMERVVVHYEYVSEGQTVKRR